MNNISFIGPGNMARLIGAKAKVSAFIESLRLRPLEPARWRWRAGWREPAW
jgi:hypothetical protein